MEATCLPSWPAHRLGEALDALAQESAVGRPQGRAPRVPPDLDQRDRTEVRRWLERAAESLGFEIEEVNVGYAEIDRVLPTGPALLALESAGQETSYLAIVRGRAGDIALLAPDLEICWVPVGEVRKVLFREFEEKTDELIDVILTATQTTSRDESARLALRSKLDPSARLDDLWLLRSSPSQLARQLREERVPVRLGAILVLQLAVTVFTVMAWMIIGRGAFRGVIDRAWLGAWVLLLATQVPLQMLSIWHQGASSLSLAKVFKQILLYGAQRLGLDELRHEGSGRLLGRALEAQAVEDLALQGGFQAITVLAQGLVAPFVLVEGAAGSYHLVLFFGCVATALLLSAAYHRRRSRWTDLRMTLTSDLVERMIGHRTRVAQELPERWHDGEDEALHAYTAEARSMDRVRVVLQAVLPRAWILLAFVGLVPAFTKGSTEAGAIATSVAGILLVHGVMTQIVTSGIALTGAMVAWSQVQPIVAAARVDGPERGEGQTSLSSQTHRAGAPGTLLLETVGVSYRYPGRATPALTDCNLRIFSGDRLLLEGPSGGGKTTLASVLTGLRLPHTGLVLLGGLDHRTLGSSAWRQRVVAAPQFHENHVFAGSFLFNLFIGRQWPSSPAESREAETWCRELGLGEVLDRMPAGIFENVGESGWQLSHGEKSRLYIARALLQRADVLILDESFAALDPENLDKTMRFVLEHASTVIIIAHP